PRVIHFPRCALTPPLPLSFPTRRSSDLNRPSFDVFMTPAFCKGKERDEVLAKLKDYLQLSPEDIERIQADYKKSWLSKDKLERLDRKSTRLNSSHQIISYAVFCLKKKMT